MTLAHGVVVVFVGELRSTVADDDIAIGEWVGIGIGHRSGADRCLLSGVKQKSYFKGVRTVFDPFGKSQSVASKGFSDGFLDCFQKLSGWHTAPMALSSSVIQRQRWLHA